MSYATGTTHYNLPQTVASDKRDWSDTNQAFADIDAAIYSAGGDAGTALTAAQNAQTTADDAATMAQSAITTANGASATAQTASEAAQLANTAAQSAQATADGAVTAAQQAQTRADESVTIAQQAQTTASNADTIALAAQGNIGTMSNLNTQDKTSLVAAINEVLSQIGGGMPTLDYSNPLFVSTASNLSYTATQDCYVLGDLFSMTGTVTDLTINGTVVAHCPSASNMLYGALPMLKLSAGDVVAINRVDTNTSFKVFGEKTV